MIVHAYMHTVYYISITKSTVTLLQSHCALCNTYVVDCMHICMNNHEPHFHHVKAFSELAYMQKKVSWVEISQCQQWFI